MKAIYEAASANGKDVVLKEKKLTPEQVAQKRISDWRRDTGGVHWTSCIN